jgi:CubicO group peptidase (beta-lactamase class C family)
MMVEKQPSVQILEIIEKYLLPLPRKVQLAIALVEGDTTTFIGAERTATGISYCDNRTAVFEIGSITKVFTATLLAFAVEEGHLQLDIPVQEYIPFQIKQSGREGVEVTLKHLANHTSGLCHQPPFINWYAFLHGHPREPFRNYSKKRYEHFLRHQMSLAFPPGQRYSYSNMGMSLVGYVLSLQANIPFEELLQIKLFKPLGMDLSTTEVAKVRQHVVTGYVSAGVTAPNWDMVALSPAGGIKTSAEDFAKFLRLQFSMEKAITMTQTPTTRTGGVDNHVSVGLGWHIIERKDQEPVLQHGGGMLGYTADVHVNVSRKIATLVLSNLGNHHQWQQKNYELDRELFTHLEVESK